MLTDYNRKTAKLGEIHGTAVGLYIIEFSRLPSANHTHPDMDREKPQSQIIY